MLGSSRDKLVPFSEVNWDEEIFTDLNKGHWRTVSGRELTPKQYEFLHALVSTCLPDALLKYDESDVMRIYAEVYRRGCDEAAGYKMKDNGRILTFNAHRNEALRTYYAIKPVIGGVLSKALIASGNLTSEMVMGKVTTIIMGEDTDYTDQVKKVMEESLADTDKYLKGGKNDDGKDIPLSDDQKREVIKVRGKMLENAQKALMIPQVQRVNVLMKLAVELEKSETNSGGNGLNPEDEIRKINPKAAELAQIITDSVSNEKVDEIIEEARTPGSSNKLLDQFVKNQNQARSK